MTDPAPEPFPPFEDAAFYERLVRDGVSDEFARQAHAVKGSLYAIRLLVYGRKISLAEATGEHYRICVASA